MATTTLPSLTDDRFYITDGGMETTLIFHAGLDLPHFAAFDLLRDPAGTDALRAYYRPYVEVARELGVGAVLDTPTWRASSDWGALLGYSREQLDEANRRAVAIGAELRDAEAARGGVPIVVNAVVGPRGDGYDPGERTSAGEAEAYHTTQIATFARTDADLVTALTMNMVEEAVGIVRAATAAALPVAVSFTVETDGRLPTGQPLGEAIEQVDAETGMAARYFMINCAHPTHFAAVVEDGGAWLDRVGGLRANASRMSHAELDESETLDEGDPDELGSDHVVLRERLRNVRLVGGCCGTDHRHVGAVCRAWQR